MINYYKNIIKAIKIFGEITQKSKVSIIIVAHQMNTNIEKCLQSLQNQSNKNFSIVIISNGIDIQERLSKYNHIYIQLRKNYGPSLARNIGVNFSKTEIVAFLDDNAICHNNWINNIIETFSDKQIIAVRGKVIPKYRKSIYNALAFYYDLGPKIIPAILDVEMNCAIQREVFNNVNGFDINLFPDEGLELSHKIIKNFSSKLIIYNPKMIVFHDFSENFFHYIKKKFRHGKCIKFMELKNQDYLTNYITSGYFKKMLCTTRYTLFQKIKILLLLFLGAVIKKFGETYALVNFIFGKSLSFRYNRLHSQTFHITQHVYF